MARLTSWWSGKYNAGIGAEHVADEPALRGMVGVQRAVTNLQENIARSQRGARPLRDAGDRKPAGEQIEAARQRAHDMRTRASKRIHSTRKGNRQYGNTPGVAVVFACLLGLMVLGGATVLGIAMLMPVFNDHSTIVVPEPPQTPMVTSGGMVHDNGRVEAYSTASTTIATSGLKAVDAKVLMVSMLPQPIEPGLLSELEGGLEVLRTKGLSIIGDHSADNADDALIEQTAELRNAIGSVPVDSPEFVTNIQQWLGSQVYDGVLLSVTDPSDPESQEVMLVMKNAQVTVPISDRAVHDLLFFLSTNGYAGD